VNVFDDEMRIVRSRIMHEERDEMFIIPFSVFELKVTIVTDGCNVLSGNVTVVFRLDVSGSEGLFAGKTAVAASWAPDSSWVRVLIGRLVERILSIVSCSCLTYLKNSCRTLSPE